MHGFLHNYNISLVNELDLPKSKVNKLPIFLILSYLRKILNIAKGLILVIILLQLFQLTYIHSITSVKMV